MTNLLFAVLENNPQIATEKIIKCFNFSLIPISGRTGREIYEFWFEIKDKQAIWLKLSF